MGQLLASFGDLLAGHLAQCLPIFLARLQNEITSVTTTKALGIIASSPIRVDLTPILADTLAQLSEFLRKKNRSMKVGAKQKTKKKKETKKEKIKKTKEGKNEGEQGKIEKRF
jgi:hypothetical protein